MLDMKFGNTSKQSRVGIFPHRDWRMHFTWSLIIFFIFTAAAFGQITPSKIVGDCECDEESQTTTCTYTVLSGLPGLNHLVFPTIPDCVEHYTIFSEFFNFAEPATITNPFCEPVYGLLDEQGMAEGQVETFTITYDACYPVGIVHALLQSGVNCEMVPVPGVIDCSSAPCIEWSIDGSSFYYYVLKPGIYASRLATMQVKANAPANLTFEMFGDLIPVVASGGDPIHALYAIAPVDQTIPPTPFLPPSEFNQQVIAIPGDEETHQFSLWSEIAVENAAPACEYQVAATIILALENSEPWIEEGQGP